MKSNLHLTWISNLQNWDIPSYLACFKSLQAVGCDYPSVVLTNDDRLHKPATWEAFRAAGTTPINIASFWENPPRVDYIIRDRWLAFWRYIDPTYHKYVVITDSRDVVFQRDPVDFCYRVSDDRLILTGEGFSHQHSPFNLIDQLEAQRDIADFDVPFTSWPVINAGVVAGPADKVKQLCLTIWTNCIRSRGKCTDQGVFNYLSYYWRQDPTFYVANPNEDPWCITGEGLKENLLDIDVVYQDGELRINEKTPYFIFHQWDRVPGIRQNIIDKYSS